jgi:hypothetical protein
MDMLVHINKTLVKTNLLFYYIFFLLVNDKIILIRQGFIDIDLRVIN